MLYVVYACRDSCVPIYLRSRHIHEHVSHEFDGVPLPHAATRPPPARELQL